MELICMEDFDIFLCYHCSNLCVGGFRLLRSLAKLRKNLCLFIIAWKVFEDC